MHKPIPLRFAVLTSALATPLLLGACAAPGDAGKAVGDGVSSFVTRLSTDFDNAARSIAANNRPSSTPGQPSAPPPGRRLQDTPLKGMFAKYPIDGTKPAPSIHGELWFPRVALIPVTIPSLQNEGWGSPPAGSAVFNGKVVRTIDPTAKAPDFTHVCWTFRAKVWTSATRSSDVPDFLYCASDASAHVRLRGVPPASIYGNFWASKTQSGSLFTQGPRQPKMAVSPKYIDSAQYINGDYGALMLLALMQDMGIDPYDLSEGNRIWVADADVVTKDF